MTRSVIATGLNDAPNFGTIVALVQPANGGVVTLDGTPEQVDGTSLPRSLSKEWCEAQGLSTKVASATVLRSLSGPNVVLVVTNGAATTADEWRRVGAAVSRQSSKTSALVLLPGTSGIHAAFATQALAEGVVLAGYDFKSVDEAPPVGVAVIGDLVPADRDAIGAALRNGSLIANSANWAKRLIDTPAMELTPKAFVTHVKERIEGLPHVTIQSWARSQIIKERLGGLLGVNRGSAEPPRVVFAEYNPPTATGPHIALVGKGVTFDSGGLSLKTAEGMMTMKTDMSGAAIVMAAIASASELGLPIRVTAIAPLTENMTGDKAMRPGDILTIRNGTTVEVLNTDAEGRLILADALSLAVEKNPDVIIDVATLTGAQAVALGDEIGGMYATSDELAQDFSAAANDAGEAMWRLPLFDSYDAHIESDVADIKNIGKAGRAGSISAALFLRRFTGDTPWIHLDIAGPGRSDAVRGYYGRGATAFGARSIVQYLTNLTR
ncbi:MAG: leucyl aminopeptidase [Acidobacteria bacterium]|nr:leucyl aminopeptidase [Acidobacteriota bacterium]